VDIIELFLVATSVFIKNYPTIYEFFIVESVDNTELYKTLPRWISIEVELEKGNLDMRFPGQDEHLIKSIKDTDYFDWLKPIMH
ncbi:hypothetical protein WAJ74_21675, partial [Acinetobacter baumannii]